MVENKQVLKQCKTQKKIFQSKNAICANMPKYTPTSFTQFPIGAFNLYMILHVKISDYHNF